MKKEIPMMFITTTFHRNVHVPDVDLSLGKKSLVGSKRYKSLIWHYCNIANGKARAIVDLSIGKKRFELIRYNSSKITFQKLHFGKRDSNSGNRLAF